MTTVIDERVVEMRFNNADFEKNVAQSMDTLDKLKAALKFDEGAKSLENIGKAASNFKLSGITESITEATSKFSVMEIAGITAIAKITSAAMDMGTALVKSLSVDQISAGFDKYADKTSAVQTIMASTAKLYDNQKQQMEDINNQMSKLMWFTDETSYNFVDMVGNIGKFTSNNIGLEESVTAMQGIANWAAKSGQNAQTASRAMYNIAQAMGVGAMKKQDWKSIELANMATAEFKETAIETAVRLGKLREVADGLYETLDGKGQFTVEQFSEELKKGWFDKEVMMETFAVYGRFTDILYELSDATGKSATELLQDADDYKAGMLDIQKYSEDTKIPVEELKAAFEDLASEENEVGRTAFKNAQEAKTFAEVIDSVKDAVSTKWSETFEIIFGNYLEAKKLWTGLANDLWSAFAEGGDERNEILQFWKDLGGRNSLIEGVINFANLLVKPLSMIKQAFRDMFPDAEGLGEKLYDITERFRELGEKLQPSQEVLDNIYRTFKGIFTIGKIVLQVITAIVKAIIPAARPFGSLLEMILQFTGYVGVIITAIAEYAEEVGFFEAITEGVIVIFGKLLTAVKTVAMFIGGGLLVVATTVGSVFSKIITAISSFLGKTQIITKVLNAIAKAVDFLKRTFSGAQKPIEKVNTIIQKSEKFFSQAATSGAEFGTVMKETGDESKKALTPLQKIGNVLKTVVSILGLAATTVIKVLANLWEHIKEFFNGIGERLNSADEDKNAFVVIFEELFNKIKEILGDAKEAIKEFFDNLGINTDGIKEAFDTISGALGSFIEKMTAGKIVAIVLSIALLALVGQAIDLSNKIGTLATAMSGFFTNINKILKKQFFRPANALTDMAKAFALVAGSLSLLIYVDKDHRLIEVAATMGILMVAMTGLAIAVEAVSKAFSKGVDLPKGLNSISKNIIALSASVVVLSAAFAILNTIEVKDLGDIAGKLGLALTGLALIAGIATAMSYWTGPMSTGVAIILALAIALRQVAKAMVELNDIPFESINANWPEYIVLFAGISALLAASSILSVRSAVGLLITAKALEMIIPQMNNIIKLAQSLPVKEAVEAALNNVYGLVTFMVGALLSVMALALLVEAKKNPIKKLASGGLFSGIGGVIAGIGVSVFLIVKSIENLHNILSGFNEGELDQIKTILTGIIGAIAVFVSVITIVNAFSSVKLNPGASLQFERLGVLLVALAVAVRIMASAVSLIAGVENQNGLWGAAGIMLVLGAILGIIVSVAGDVPKAIPAMAALIAAAVAMGVLIGELAVLSLLVSGFKDDLSSLIGAVVIMGGIFAGMYFLMTAMSKLSGIQAGTIFGLALTITAIGATLAALTILSSYNLPGLAVSLVGLMGVLRVLGFVFTVLGQMDTPGIKKIISIVAIIGVIAAIGASLYLVAKQDWRSILAAGSMIVAALAVVGGILIILDKIGSQGGQLVAGVAIAMMAASMVAIALAIKVLDGVEWGAIGKFAAAMGIMAGILGILAGITAAFPPFGVALEAVAIAFIGTAAAFGIAALAFLGFAVALPILAEGLNALTPALVKFATEVPFLELAEGLISISEGLQALGLAGLFVGLGAIGIGLLAAAIYALGLAAGASVDSLNQLAAVPLIDIAKGLFALGVSGAVIGALAPLIVVAAGAISLFSLALFALKLALDGMEGVFEGFTNAFSSMVDSVKQKVEDIKTAVKGLFPDLASAFSGSEANGVVAAAMNCAMQIAGGKHPDTGFIGGLASVLGWHSEPDIVLGLLDDTGQAFLDNSSAVSAAQTSGTQIGDSFGKSFFESASAWFSNLGANISSWWSGVTASFKGGSTQIQNDLGTTGAAAEKFGNKTEKTGNIVTKAMDWIGEKAGGLKEKIDTGLKDTTGKLADFVDVENYTTKMTEEMTESMKGATEGVGGFGDAAEAAGGKASKGAKGVKEFADTLKDTISNQLNMFEKFEIKTEVTAEQMLENMRSNIDGFASWSHRMSVLAERFANHGIADTLYEELAKLGPKGYETMNAFYTMTEDQLEQVRELWATGMTLSDNQTDIVASGYQYMGEMATQGFSNALDDHKALHAARQGGTNLAKAGADGIAEYLIISSPSKLTEKYGNYTVEGLAKGIDSVYGQGILYFAVKHVCEHIITCFEEGLSVEALTDLGGNLLTNLFEALLGNGDPEENPIISGFLTAFEDVSLVDEVLTTFVEHIMEFLNELFIMDDNESPSQLFFNYALMWIQGIINSLMDEANLAMLFAAITAFCEAVVRQFLVSWEMYGEDGAIGRSEVFYRIGLNAMQGLIDGIEEKGAEAIALAESIAQQIVDTINSALDINSPSKVMIKTGHSIGEGLVIGMQDSAANVYNAAKSVADGSIEGAEIGFGRLQDVINESLDFNPVITPILDLSLIREQLNELNGMMYAGQYGASFGQNEGDSSGTTPSQINFTQNNYSPKALSRVEIYRDTKNQLSMMKGVVMAHG